MEVYPIDKKIEQLFQEISRRIFRLQNGRSMDSMERIGADTRGQIGASYLSLKNLANQYQPNQNLAILLWGTRKREEQIVACFLFPAQALIVEKIIQLLQISHGFETAEYFGTLVLSKRENLPQQVDEYLNSDHPFLQAAALTAISRSRIDNKTNPLFSDSYILNINCNNFINKQVQTIYNRISIFYSNKRQEQVN